jgi:carotenoid phi-ring synthase / carotenoid chi-ring synthase
VADISNSDEHTFPVVIIGGGLAGLTAAVHLAERGITPLVLDSDARWTGGRLAGGDPDTFTYDGRAWSFQPEHGVHAVWGGYVNMRALLERFTQTPLQLSPGEEWLNRWGREVRRIEAGNAIRSRWIPAPLHYLQLLFNPTIWANIIPLDFLSLPGVLVSILLTIGVDPIAEKRAWNGLTMREFFRGWTPNLRATFTGVGANLLAAPKEAIDLTAYIAALRFYTMLRRDAWTLHYFTDNAHIALIDPLVNAIEQRGGMLRRGATAVALQRVGDHWRVIVEDSSAGGYRSLTAQHVILATHAPGAQRLLQNSSATATAAQRMIFPTGLRNAVIRLWFSTSPREGTPGGMFTGDFVPDNFFWLHRLYSDCRIWHEATGGSVIEVHLYGTDALLDQPDANLMILAATEIQRAFPELRGSFVHGVTRRNSKVHTRWRVPTQDSLHVTTPWHNMWACGDWIGYETPSLWMERAVTTGMAAANAVLQANQHEPFAILQPPRPELMVRVLGAVIRAGRFILGKPIGLLAGLRRRKPASEAV